MLKKSFYTSILVLFLMAWQAQAQEQTPPPSNEPPAQQPTIYFEKPKPEWKQKMRYGGNLWGGYWSGLYIDASPMVGYELNSKGTVAGLGGVLIYKGGGQQYQSSTAFGVRPFVRQAVFKSFFVHAEYEVVNALENNFYDYVSPIGQTNASLHRRWGGSPLIGIGLYQGGGGRQKGGFIAVMYNLNPDRGFIGSQSFSREISLRVGFF